MAVPVCAQDDQSQLASPFMFSVRRCYGFILAEQEPQPLWKVFIEQDALRHSSRMAFGPVRDEIQQSGYLLPAHSRKFLR